MQAAAARRQGKITPVDPTLEPRKNLLSNALTNIFLGKGADFCVKRLIFENFSIVRQGCHSEPPSSHPYDNLSV